MAPLNRMGFFSHDPFAQLAGHALHFIDQQIQLSGDLAVGQVQPHQVQADHPHLQWTMMPFQNRATQIVELLLTALAHIALAVGIAIMMAPFLDLMRPTFRTGHAIGPAQLAYNLITLRIVNQLLDLYHACILPYRFCPHLLEIGIEP
jgi:hypothetical protein